MASAARHALPRLQSSSTSHSRASSLSSPAPSPLPQPASSRSGSRRPSQLPSSSQLQSFFEGIGFAARCSDGLRRGESRSASRQPTHAGKDREASNERPSSSLAVPPFRHGKTLAEEEEGFISDSDCAELDLPEDGDGQVQVFEEGQRIGVGLFHDDEVISDCFPANQVGRLEIVRKLGTGSYAVVYLARAIISDPRDDEEADLFESPSDVVYGKEYALKCLSKRNLSDEMLEVQKFEATLHQALPLHPNIVSMHGAWETSSWLYLLLEYCPGQDLFYWLEQSKDHDSVDPLMHPSASFTTARAQQRRLAADFGPESHSATPPSPTLLSITAMSSLLSRRRLRLISRMFVQMCDAVAATHAVGISHRDIKPENFICCDDDNVNALERKITVKLTDWGLGTSEEDCGDFDCGSKPYMAYECRNNLAPSYRPREADIWSLGVVLLNLLFHRSPWADPTPEDPDFAEYCQAPVDFLQERFSGIGIEVATFLAENVLNCTGPRVSAQNLSHWASGLVRYMSDSASPRQAAVSEAAVPLVASRPTDIRRLSIVLSQANSSRSSPRASLLAQQMSDLAVSNNSDMPIAIPAAVNRTLTYGEDVEETKEVLQPAQTDQTGENAEEANIDSETAALAAKARRRKRGARRGRPHTTTNSSDVHPRLVKAEGKADLANELASASQSLARELSSRPPIISTNTEPAGAGKAGFMGKFKSALKNGNPDLEAFVQNARAREAQRTGETYSAPGMMQPHLIGSNGNGISSMDSVGTRSSGSAWSVDENSRSHWASTSSRRERVGRRPYNEPGSAQSPSRYSSVSSSSDFSPSSVSSGPSKLSSYRSPSSSRFSATSYSSDPSIESAPAKSNAAGLDRIDERIPISHSPSPVPVAPSSVGSTATFKHPSPAPPEKKFSLKGLFRHQN